MIRTRMERKVNWRWTRKTCWTKWARTNRSNKKVTTPYISTKASRTRTNLMIATKKTMKRTT